MEKAGYKHMDGWTDGCTNKHEFIEPKHLNECIQGSIIYQKP